MVIGITGSSGAGKSTVCEILQNKYNAKIISADKVSKELSQKGTVYLSEIVEKFGHDILLGNGELNRKKLANIIYNNKEKRELLNNCTLKYISKEIKNQIEKYKNSAQIIAIDAPLLLEAKLEKICTITIAVISNNKEAQITRIVERDKIDREHAKARISAQHENDFYSSNTNYTIINDDKILVLESQIDNILKNIMSQP